MNQPKFAIIVKISCMRKFAVLQYVLYDMCFLKPLSKVTQVFIFPNFYITSAFPKGLLP